MSGSAPDYKKKQAEYQRDYRLANLRKIRTKEFRRYYGITLDDYEAMLDAQGHVCAICRGDETRVDATGKKRRKLAVDHCHASGKVRGLLCSNCNHGLGAFKDNPETMRTAIRYLETHAAPAALQ